MSYYDTTVEEAATRLYKAGRWTCPELTSALEAELWDDLRVALRLPVGTATSRGIGREH